MKFRQVTETMTQGAGVTLAEVAEAFGRRPETVSRWRNAEKGEEPPHGWELILAPLIRQAAQRHREHAAQLDALFREVSGAHEG